MGRVSDVELAAREHENGENKNPLRKMGGS